MSARLSLRDIACVRGQRLLFEALDLTLEPGGAALVTGPNGIGKSSLIRIAAGLLAPAAGTVDRSGRIALLAEAAAFDSELRTGHALRFWARLDGSAARVGAALQTVGLAAIGEVPVRLLSTGQRRRLALARMLLGGAEIWLLDEPANGLDAAGVALLETLVADHRAAGGIALVATHQPVTLPGAREVAL